VDRGPDRSEIGPGPDRTGENPDRTGLGPVLVEASLTGLAAKWHGMPVPPFFWGGSRGTAVPCLIRSTGTEPRTEFTNFMDRGPDRFAPVRGRSGFGPNIFQPYKDPYYYVVSWLQDVNNKESRKRDVGHFRRAFEGGARLNQNGYQVLILL